MSKQVGYFGEVLIDSEVDRLLSTILLSVFFVIGSFGNLFYIHIHLKQRSSRSFWTILRRKSLFSDAEKRPSDPKKLDARILKNKTKINNDAVFASSIANCIICLFYIPYTIVVRIWSFELPGWPCRAIEWIKDSFLYFNFFMLTIIAFERYVAICRTNYYKTLEKKINKIIWFFYFIALAFSLSNFFADMKCSSPLGSTPFNSTHFNASNELGSISSNKFNSYNLFVSMILFGTNALITTFFYAKICVFYTYLIRKRLHGRPRKLEPQKAPKLDDRKSCDAAVFVSQTENAQFGEEAKSKSSLGSFKNEEPSGSIVKVRSDGQVRVKRTRSKIFIRSKSTPNITENSHVICQKRSQPVVKFKRAHNKNTITKISVMLSVLTTLSVIPFIFVSLRLVKHSKLIYFLYFSENVFNPIIYICFQRHYRNYLIKRFKSFRGAQPSV